jgi:inhibitor of cysteine peptidase
MFRKFQPLALLLLFSMFASACNPSKSISLTAADAGKQVSIKVDEQVVITLDGNPSTGYTWESKDLDTALFEQVGDTVFQSSNPGLVGSGGTLTLTFRALKSGTSPLLLVYHRPWEVGIDPIATFEITVTVK